MDDFEVEQLIDRMKSCPRPHDSTQRHRLWEAARSFSARVEDEHTFQYRLISAPLQVVIPRIASDLHIFEILEASKQPVSTSSLAEQTKADEMLLGRILRYLSSQLMISSPSPRLWTSSSLTPFLANPAYAAGLRFGTGFLLPSALEMPALLAGNSYKDTSSLDTTAFQKGLSTSSGMFEWLQDHPTEMKDFQKWMAETHKRQKSAFDALPLGDLVRGCASNTPIFVDVGGGDGQSCKELQERYSDLVGRVINQDLRATKTGLQSLGIEHQDYDFFTEQPVKDAKTYHFRKILRNWSDGDCVKLLRRAREAMSVGSVLLVDDVVMKESELDWHACYVDLVMGMFFGTRERTLEEFRAIFDKAGLSMSKIVQYGGGSGEHIIMLEKGP
ncbi:S-adenosyl-L-methionine-dependent methyltransferase [Xylariaceae sp. FL0662B]|nr:S-adenosyl-L-methionine-dependent methyltransferase [Xylariaceae sp. FL0662B]